MKKIITVLCCFMSCIAYAQNYYVQRILELPNDLTARRNVITDSLGNNCALIRVNIPSVNNIKFNSSIVGDPEILPGEYNVYLPQQTNILSIYVNGETYNVDFSKFDITIEEKKCYRVILSKNNPSINKTINSQKSRTLLKANYDNVIVLIDGVPVGQTPIELDNVSLGKHIVSVANTFGVTMRDTLIDFSNNNIINLALYEQPKDTMSIQDTSIGWHDVIFGVNIVKESGKKGLVNYLGEVIVPCDFDDVYPYIQNGYYWVKKDNKRGLYEPGKGLIGLWEYNPRSIFYDSSAYNHKHKCIEILQDGLWGVVSTATGEIVVPAKYEKVSLHDDAIQVTYKKPGYMAATGVFLYDGTETIKPRYEYMIEFANGYAFFLKFDETIGFTDIYGNETYIPANYDIFSWVTSGAPFATGVFSVKDKVSGKWGYMNSQLELVIPCIYDAIDKYHGAPNFNNGIVPLKLNEDKLVIDSKGHVIVSCKDAGIKNIEIVRLDDDVYNKGRFFRHESWNEDNNTLIKIENEEGLYGLMNVKGRVVVPCKYKEKDIEWYNDNNVNYFVLKEGDEYCVINEHQEELFRLSSEMYIADISDGIVEIRETHTNSYGFLNTKGEILSSSIYGYGGKSSAELSNKGELWKHSNDIALRIEDFRISEGLAILNIGDKFGFIDNIGNVKVPLIYTAATPFENGVAYVRQQDGKWKKIYKDEL